ncbi:MAG: ankyrin repeat domain-containing protein [Puniceicoccales bacterium]|jgi:ankyrin repeat protein|nr:ankyrin repeat domain-containing protein [Puniceicoccales bacterium]
MNKNHNTKNKLLKNIALGSYLLSSFAGTLSQLQADPIHAKAANSKTDEVQQLIASGINVNQKNSTGATPLHFSDTEEMTVLLCDLGADVNATDDNGDTPLHNALRRILYAAEVGDARDAHGKSNKDAARIEKCRQRLACVQRLLREGADPYKTNHKGYSPSGIVESALKSGRFNDGNINNATISSEARGVYSGTRELFRATVASPRATEELSYAVESGDEAKVRQLLASGVSPNRQNSFGYRPLDAASTPTMVELLCDNGAQINQPNQHGDTSLHLAVLEDPKNLALIRTLLLAGARIDIPNRNGYTALSIVQQAVNQNSISNGLLPPRTLTTEERNAYVRVSRQFNIARMR